MTGSPTASGVFVLRRGARRSRWGIAALLTGLALLPSIGAAAPPALPDDARSGSVEPTDPEPAPAPAEPSAEPSAEVDATADLSIGADVSADDSGLDGATDLGGDTDTGADTGDAFDLGGEETENGAKDASAASKGEKSDDPAMLNGRREPSTNTVRGGIGLFNTTLADVGGRHSIRFGLHTDFFRRSGFIYDSQQYGTDTNSRFRGTVNIGYSPLPWGEIFLSISSQANRNLRDQPGRQDSVSNFALGDIDFGIKGAHRFYRGGAIGLGGQLALGLLSGTNRLTTERVNFAFDALFTLDIRYLTAKAFPFRFTTNIGWILDNSLKVLDFAQIADTTSREVNRFALGVNHSRVRMRYGVDFPTRLGKNRQFGLDPIAELAWDVSTFGDEELFGQSGADPVSLPRSSIWTTFGLRANVIHGLHLDAAIDIGLRSPAFEYGPPVPPWQLLFGLGWSFDPRPVIKEVPAEVEPVAPPPAVTDGRIIGEVVDAQGAAIAGAVVSFPGLTSTALLTDAGGTFTSFRFPEGEVTVVVTLANGQSQESSATVLAEQETSLTITFGGDAAAPASGILDGTFVDDQGQPLQVSLQVTGQGIDEPFTSTADGLLRIELPAGDYAGFARADGFEDTPVDFTITAGDEMVPVKATLKALAPVETPNVKGSKRSLSLKKRIRYSGDEVSDKSHAILDEVAAFLKGHPEFAAIEVAVHTDDRGNPGKRSSARAESVRSYLLSQGVSPDRLSAKGYADRKPVAVNLTASGRAKNNRTKLLVKKYTGE